MMFSSLWKTIVKKGYGVVFTVKDILMYMYMYSLLKEKVFEHFFYSFVYAFC